MRNFSPNFTANKDSRANVPVNLLELLLEGGQNTLYFSDRELTAGGVTYGGQVLDWGIWGEEDACLILANTGSPPLADTFRQYPPEGALVKMYQWFSGLEAQEKALVGMGKVMGPVIIEEEKIALPLGSLEKGFHKSLGRRLAPGDYPYAPAQNWGKLEPIVLGQVEASPAWLVDAGGSSRLLADLSGDTSVISLEDTSSFPASGAVIIEEELINYTAKTSQSLTGCQRGQGGTLAKSHRQGIWAYEHNAPQVYVAASHPGKAVDAVYLEERKLASGAYSVNLANSTLVPGRVLTTITLNKPWPPDAFAGFKTLVIWPDALGTGNTAQNAGNCYDQDLGNVALLKSANSRLVVKRQGLVADLGKIERVKLEVRHFSKAQWAANEKLALYLGTGSSWDLAGYLSRPATEDLTQEGSHEHQAPTRTALVGLNNIFYQVYLDTNILPYVYDGDFSKGCALSGSQAFKVNRATTVNNVSGQVTKVWACFTYYQVNTAQRMKLGVTHPNGASYWFYASPVSAGQASRTDKIDITLGRNWQWSNFVGDGAYFWGEGNGGVAGNAYVMELWWEVEYTPSSGTKAAQGVSAPTKKIRDTFDLTALWSSQSSELNGWEWFSGRQIKLELQNPGSQTEVYLPTVNWEISYTPQNQSSPVIYADLKGYADDAQGTYSGSPGALIENPADIFKLILGHQDFLNLPLSQYLNQGAFAKARQNMSNRHYRLGGNILAPVKSEDLLSELGFNCRSRFYFDAEGKAKLVFRL